MLGDGLDLRSSLSRFSDSSNLLNHVLSSLVNEVSVLTERIQVLEADNRRRDTESKVDESVQVEDDLPAESTIVPPVPDLSYNTPGELAQINATMVRIQAELTAHKLDISETVDGQRVWVLEQIADSLKAMGGQTKENTPQRQITFVGSGQRDTAGRMASLETKLVSQEFRLKAMEHSLESARKSLRFTDGMAEGKEAEHSGSGVIGRLNALETQVADLYESLSMLPSHDDWEEYRTLMTGQWEEMEARLAEESKQLEENTHALSSSMVDMQKELDSLKEAHQAVQHQATMPLLEEEEHQHPLARLHISWTRSLRVVETGFQELRETENGSSKLAVEFERLLPKIRSSVKDLQELISMFVPLEESSGYLLQDVVKKLVMTTSWSWVSDQRCERTLEKLDALVERAQELLRFDVVEHDAAIVLSDLGNVEALRTTLTSSISITTVTLSKRLNLVQIAKQVKMIDVKLDSKLDKQGIHENIAEMKARLGSCADMEEVEKLLIKKASVAELQDARQTLQRQIELIATQSSPHDFHGNRTQELQSDALVRSNAGPERLGGAQLFDQSKLSEKVDTLGRFVIQAQEKLLLLVPRPELESALRAIIDELSAVKARAITNDTLDTVLQQKADKADVQRLVAVVAKSIDELQVPFTPAAATRQRCIACDRRTVAFDMSLFSDEDEFAHKDRPVTAPAPHNEPRSPSPPQQRQENFPPLVADGIFSSYNRFIPAQVSLPQHMSERVRSSAGGGMKVPTTSRAVNVRF